MATTNLIVDFLVIGFVSLIWITPLIMLLVNIDTTNFDVLRHPAAIPVTLAFAYIIGIAINRLADDITGRWNRKLKEIYFEKDARLYHQLTNYIIAVSDSATEYLSYRRSVIRTARACALNFIIAFPLWLTVAVFKPTVINRKIAYILSLFSLFASIILVRVWYVVLKGYLKGIKDLYDALYKSDSNRKFIDML